MSDAEIFELKQRVAALERRLDALDGGGSATAGPPAGPSADPELQRLLAGGNKIGAIKRYRELTGLGLAEAKDAIEDIERHGFRLS